MKYANTAESGASMHLHLRTTLSGCGFKLETARQIQKQPWNSCKERVEDVVLHETGGIPALCKLYIASNFGMKNVERCLLQQCQQCGNDDRRRWMS
jgi:hypothetical protein